MTEYEITEIELNGEIVASYNSIKRILEYKAPQEEIDTLNQKIMNKRRMGIKPGLSLEGEFETLEIKDIKEIRPLNIV